jgi:glycerol kinase
LASTGTTGVKAALFDQRLQPVAEARRDKVNRHPGGMGRAGWREVLAVVTEAVAELLKGADREVLACGSTTRASLCSPGTGRAASRSARSSSGRTSDPRRSWTSSPTWRRRSRSSAGCHSTLLLRAKLAWLLRHNDDVKKALEAGRLRMGTVDSFLCDRLGAGFATDASTASRTQLHALGTPGFSERLCEIFGVPIEVLPEVRDTAGELGTLSHESWPSELPFRGQVVDQQAALAGAACVEPGRVKATYGTGVFVLAHVGDGVPEPAGGLLPTVAWSIDGRVEYALDGGVFAAGAMLEWMCNQLGIAEDPPALSKLARGRTARPGLGCAGWPGSAHRGGDPMRER